MNINTKVRFDVIQETGTVEHRATCSNVLTNNGAYDWLRQPLGDNLALGVGVQPEVPEVNQLQQYRRSAKGTYSEVQSGRFVPETGTVEATFMLKVLFPIEQESVNYTEFGIFDTSQTRLQTYAQIKTPEGVGMAITVRAGERLQCLYEITVQLPAYQQFNLNISGVSTLVTQVVSAFSGSPRRLLPEAVVSIVKGAAPVPTVLQPVLGAVLSGSAQYIDTMLEVSVQDGAGTVGIVQSGTTYKVSWHLDPPVPVSADWRFKLLYTNEVSSNDS